MLIVFFFVLMIRRPPRSTRTDTLFPTRRSSDLPDGRKFAGGHAAPFPCLVACRFMTETTHHKTIGADRPSFASPAYSPRTAEISSSAGLDRKSTRLNSSH